MSEINDGLNFLYGHQNANIADMQAEEAARLEQELSQQFDKYYAHPASSFHDDRIAKQFYQQRLNHLGYKPYPQDGLVTFGASGTDQCDRQIVFKNAKIKTEKTPDIPFRGRQRRVGSAVIEYFQLDIAHMKKRLQKDALFEFATLPNGEYAMEDAMQVRQVFEYNGVKFAITAKPDGIFNYNPEPGRRFLFEYKTKAGGVNEMNAKLDFKGAQAEHLRQVTAEALVFGIDEGFIVYESMHKPTWFSDFEGKTPKTRKTWSEIGPKSDLRVFYFKITERMKQDLLSELAAQAELVYNGEIPEMTVDMTSKCGFCPFKDHCKSMLTHDERLLLQQVENNYAKDPKYAGKYDHRNLLNYLND